MPTEIHSSEAEVFISYARRDRARVLELAEQLAAAGVRLWVDQHGIKGGANYGLEIVRGIKGCKVLMLMCSAAALQSRNVQQEILIAWKYERPYVPLLLEPVSFDERLEYWLEGWQRVEVLAAPPEQWLPQVLRALARVGVSFHNVDLYATQTTSGVPATGNDGLRELMALASWTELIRPVRPQVTRAAGRVKRDMGGLPPEPTKRFRLGEWVSLEIETDRPGHLLLLDVGTSGKTYCLCPSQFAPATELPVGKFYLPQAGSPWEAFYLSGQPGREQLLAILTDEPLALDWLSNDPKIPARVLEQADIDALLAQLRSLGSSQWTALSTYFAVEA